MILKFQKPLASSKPDPPVLVSNEDRTLSYLVPFDSLQHMFEFVDKFYAECSMLDDDEPVIIEVIGDQGW
jgi:hypothetical protein